MREAVIREAREETGIVVEPEEVLDVSDAIYRDDGRIQFRYIFVDFRCHAVKGELHAASDATAARWLNRAELDSIPIVPTALRVLRKAFENDRTPALQAGREDQQPNRGKLNWRSK